jgi:hypothetical protein
MEFTDAIAVADSMHVSLELPLKGRPLLRYGHVWHRFDSHPDNPSTANVERSSHDSAKAALSKDLLGNTYALRIYNHGLFAAPFLDRVSESMVGQKLSALQSQFGATSVAT